MTTRDLLKQAGLKTGDKVVCMDDTYQRVDLAHTPDGLLVRGRVYCVSGVSECGGVTLVGLRVISGTTRKEIGCHPYRFLPLDQFRERFPKGMPEVPSPWAFLDDYVPKSRESIALPAIDGLEEPKPHIDRVIDVIFALHGEHDDDEEEETPPWLQTGYWPDQSPEHVREELRALLRSPQRSAYMNQSWTFWHRVLRNQRPTLLFCRERSPAANVLFQMCMFGNILTEEFLEGNLRERDFPVLTGAAGRMAGAPIRISDARDPDVFLKVLFEAHKVFEYALLDWKLEGEEMAAAYRITRDSQITFLFPHEDPRDCLPEPDLGDGYDFA